MDIVLPSVAVALIIYAIHRLRRTDASSAPSPAAPPIAPAAAVRHPSPASHLVSPEVAAAQEHVAAQLPATMAIGSASLRLYDGALSDGGWDLYAQAACSLLVVVDGGCPPGSAERAALGDFWTCASLWDERNLARSDEVVTVFAGLGDMAVLHKAAAAAAATATAAATSSEGDSAAAAAAALGDEVRLEPFAALRPGVNLAARVVPIRAHVRDPDARDLGERLGCDEEAFGVFFDGTARRTWLLRGLSSRCPAELLQRALAECRARGGGVPRDSAAHAAELRLGGPIVPAAVIDVDELAPTLR